MIERMFLQGSLLDIAEPTIGSCVDLQRLHLDERSWIDAASHWMDGADVLFDRLVADRDWQQRRNVVMFDRLVDEPRLVSFWRTEDESATPLPPAVACARCALSEHYGVDFDSVGVNFYRDGDDSVAWHGDRHRHTVDDPIVAIVSVGAARPFKLRPRGGGPSRSWNLGRGDLLVMGGACQHDWEHCVPKVASAGPRISITFRHGA